jgi:transposase-like protein
MKRGVGEHGVTRGTVRARRLRGEPSPRRSHPAAAQLAEGIEECLACFAMPAAHRVRVRTTNGLRRLNQELKRRARVGRIFPHRASLLLLATAPALERSEEWVSGRRYLDVDRLWEERPRPVLAAPATADA